MIDTFLCKIIKIRYKYASISKVTVFVNISTNQNLGPSILVLQDANFVNNFIEIKFLGQFN